MPGAPYPNVKLQFSDALGRPLSGGKLYTYASGTLTPQSTYTDQALTQANANPVILDASGRATVFLSPVAYKFILQNALGVVQWTADGVTEAATLLELTISGSSGSNSVGFLQSGAGAVARTAQAKMRDTLSVADFNILPGNTAAQNNTGWANLLAALPSTGAEVMIPFSSTPYDFSVMIAPSTPIHLRSSPSGFTNGAQLVRGATLRWTGGASVAISISGTGATGSILEGFALDNTGTATVGIDIDSGAGGAQLRHVVIDSPATAFSNSAVRVGNTGSVSNSALYNCMIRAAAPVNLRVVAVGATMTLFDTHIMDGTTQNVLLGTATTEVENFQAFGGSSFEQVTNLDSVYIQRAQHVVFTGCYFESGGTGYAINIPATCTIADNIQVNYSWFTGIAVLPASVINCDFSLATLNASGNTVLGGVTTSFIQNNACRRIFGVGNKYADAITFVNSKVRVTNLGDNGNTVGSQQANIDGSFSIANGTPIIGHLSVTTPYNPPSLLDGEIHQINVTVTGASRDEKDTAIATFDSITGSGWFISAIVTGADTVTVTILNKTGGTVDLAAGTVRVDVWKH